MLVALVLGLGLLFQSSDAPLVTGKLITPLGDHEGVGSYPIAMAISPDGAHCVVTNAGFRQFLSVVEVRTGNVVERMPFNKVGEGLYYGLCFGPDGTLFVSNGALDTVSRFSLEGGRLKPAGEPLRVQRVEKSPYARTIAGIALSSDGAHLLAVENESSAETGFTGNLAVLEVATGQTLRRIPVGGYPMAVAALTKGPHRDQKAYVSSERDGTVAVVDWQRGKLLKKLKVGYRAFELLLNKDQSRLYAASWGSDTVSIIDTAKDKVLGTVVLRPAELRGLSGTSPLGMSLSPDEKMLYVALADMNAVAIVSLVEQQVQGYIPTGWYPTSVVAAPTGEALLVACAKGVSVRNPNDKVYDLGPTAVEEAASGRNNSPQYTQNRLEGTVGRIPLPPRSAWAELTRRVLANNFVERAKAGARQTLKVPGIKHVIYIIKENRTYDQVLGDLPEGNGEPSLCLFPREVTPNQHALAERFVLLDNFYVCAECSMDGWSWSTTGICTPYISRNSTYNYSRRGKAYDSEGQNSGSPVDLLKLPDVSRPPSGFIWEHALKHGKSVANYGMFVQSADKADKRFTKEALPNTVMANKRFLLNRTSPNFAGYDLSYADSDAWAIYKTPAPKQVLSFGAHGAKSRFSAWKREFDEMVRKGKMPDFMTIRLGNDHTAGTRAGFPSPRAMVADNDYAVGQVVEAVSHSPFWKNTAIFILEDDAQAGHDHVDCHRSTAYVISPYIRRGTVDSTFYNTDSMLRTMTMLLGLPPMNQYDAVANVFTFFTQEPVNLEPYKAILPPKAIIGEVNGAAAYRAKDSVKLFPRFVADSGDELEQNDILWRAVKKTKAPAGAIKGRIVKDDD